MTDDKFEKLLEYLAKEGRQTYLGRHPLVEAHSGRKFVIPLRFSVKLPDDSFDYEHATIDFAKKEISWYVAKESGHNGDHYACESGTVPWEQLLSVYNYFYVRARDLAAKEAERELQEKRWNELGEARLREVLGD